MSNIKIGPYDYDGLCHAFMYQQRDKEGFIRGSTGGDRLSFYNNSIYSYRSLLATLGKDYIFVYKHIANYSPTSSKHARKLYSSIDTSRYTVYVIEFASYSAQMAVYQRDIKELLGLHERARKNSYEYEIRNKIAEAVSYAERFKQRRSGEYKWIKMIQNNPMSYAKEISDDLKAERKAEIKKERKQSIIRLQKKADYFLDEKLIITNDYSETVFLKKHDDMLITSNSVRVYLRDAKIMYKRWVAGKKILGETLGIYRVVIANEKKVKIGCTTICAAELHRFFKPTTEKIESFDEIKSFDEIEKGIK